MSLDFLFWLSKGSSKPLVLFVMSNPCSSGLWLSHQLLLKCTAASHSNRREDWCPHFSKLWPSWRPLMPALWCYWLVENCLTIFLNWFCFLYRSVLSARASSVCRDHTAQSKCTAAGHTPPSPLGRSWYHLPSKGPVTVTITVFGPMVPTLSAHPWPHADDLATQSHSLMLCSLPPPLPPTQLPAAPYVCPALPAPQLGLMVPKYAVPCLSHLIDISCVPPIPSHASLGPDHLQAHPLSLYPISPALKATPTAPPLRLPPP